MSRLVTRCTTGVHPPSWGGGKVDVQVTPVLGTDWKGLYANAHCAALASEETNHTRKNGVCVSSSPPGGGSSRMLPACTMGCAFMSPVPPARVPPMCPAPPSCLVEQGCIGWGACCGFAGHTVVLTLNGSHPGELHYKMAKGQCDTRGAWTSALHTPVPPTTHSSPTKLLGVALCGTPHTTSVWCGGGLHSTPPVEGRGPAALTLQWGHPPPAT